jgi:membrane protein YdbS with pleckstrin-like domain
VDEALRPAELAWLAVSPRLVIARRLSGAVLLVPMLLLLVLLVGFLGSWLVGVLIAVLGAALVGWLWWLVGRACRSWGYAERDDDLLVRHGILVQRLSVVPYGRMQFVDVTAGPLDRRLGIATVHLHTAAAATDAVIPGLPAPEAARLRDRLAALGEARAAGL